MAFQRIYHIIHSVLTDEATEEEHHLLSEWLKADEANQTEYEKLKRLHETLSFTSKEKAFDTEAAWTKVRQQTLDKKRTLSWIPVWARYAAMVAIIASIGLLFLPKSPTEMIVSEVNMEEFDQPTLLLDNGEVIALNEESFSMQEKHVMIKNDAQNKLIYQSGNESQDRSAVRNNHLVIPKGKTYQLQLSDGTEIWLNAETELTYPTQFTGDKREVTLVGEAFFKVAKNTDLPFVVKANSMEVTVLGTAFNISCYTTDNTLTTTLIEGSVSVKADNKEAQTIVPSQQFTYNKTNTQCEIKKVNTTLFTSWMEGVYLFKDATLEEIMKKLQRWHSFSVQYADESIKNNRYSLTIERDANLDQILEIISYTSTIKLERIDNIINIKKTEKGE